MRNEDSTSDELHDASGPRGSPESRAAGKVAAERIRAATALQPKYLVGLRFARRLTHGDWELAADLTQEAMVKLEHARKLEPDTPNSYVRWAVYSCWVDHYRRWKVRLLREEVGIEGAVAARLAAPLEAGEDKLWLWWVLEGLDRFIKTLTALDQQIVVEVLMNGETMVSLCDDLNLEASAGYLKLQEAKGRLRRWLLGFERLHGRLLEKASSAKVKRDTKAGHDAKVDEPQLANETEVGGETGVDDTNCQDEKWINRAETSASLMRVES